MQNNLKFFALTIIWLFLSLIGSRAIAASSLFETRADWQLAAGSSTNIDFSTADSGNPFSNPADDIYFQSLTLKGVTFLEIRSLFNTNIIPNVFGGVLRANLPANTKSIAADLMSAFGQSGTISISLSTGEVFSLVIDGQTPIFAGVVSTSNIDWVEFSLSNDYVVVDNFSFVAPPAVQTVGIDIVPGSATNRVVLSSQATVEVAILSSATLDATKVNPSTVRFGRNGSEAAATQYTFKDVNKDGRRDMLLTFRVANTGIISGDTVAKLTGRLLSGQNIQGSDAVRTVPSNVKSPF